MSVDTLVSSVDPALTRSGNGDIVLGSGGDLTVTAISGNVPAGTLLSAGDLNVVSGSLTVGFNYSKDKLSGEASVPVI